MNEITGTFDFPGPIYSIKFRVARWGFKKIEGCHLSEFVKNIEDMEIIRDKEYKLPKSCVDSLVEMDGFTFTETKETEAEIKRKNKMSEKIVKIGQKFGKWNVIQSSDPCMNHKGSHKGWTCCCDCGVICMCIEEKYLLSGQAPDCDCFSDKKKKDEDE